MKRLILSENFAIILSEFADFAMGNKASLCRSVYMRMYAYDCFTILNVKNVLFFLRCCDIFFVFNKRMKSRFQKFCWEYVLLKGIDSAGAFFVQIQLIILYDRWLPGKCCV